MQTATKPAQILTRNYHKFFKTPDKKKEHYARKLVGFSSDQMYNVVADVKNYNKFVPFCTKSRIIHEKRDHLLIANLSIGFPPIVEHYTSTVTLRRPLLVRAVCQDGRLFTSLETTWKFNAGLLSNPQTCIIDFYINFEFKSAMYSQLATLFFEKLVNQMEMAFIEEAKRRFGAESLPIYELDAVKS